MGGKTFLIFYLLLTTQSSLAAVKTSNIEEFQFLEFSEAQSLFRSIEPDITVVKLLDETFNTVFYRLNNTIMTRKFPYDQKLKRSFLRVGHWNLDGVRDLAEVELQIELLKNNDIFTLNGVSWGSPETNYRNIAEDFAKTVGAEYIYVAEFLEMDPALLSYSAPPRNKQNPYLTDAPKQATNFKLGVKMDVEDFKGLEGNAIVSKFPIKSSRIVRLPACYDWFEEEAKLLKLPYKERERKAPKNRLGEGMVSKIRRGGRVALIADIALNKASDITVISVQLENRSTPQCREEQMQFLLNAIQNIKNPVILGANLNNFEKNAAPTTIGKEVMNTVKDPQVLAGKVISTFNPFALPTTIFSFVVGGYRKKNNPTVSSVPIILRNKSAKLFKIIDEFQFQDGNSFDLSGSKNLNYNHTNKRLANSNERARKGFIGTYETKKAIGTGRYKTDWIFVKPNHKNYIPAYAQTINVGSGAMHNPISVEIML